MRTMLFNAVMTVLLGLTVAWGATLDVQPSEPAISAEISAVTVRSAGIPPMLKWLRFLGWYWECTDSGCCDGTWPSDDAGPPIVCDSDSELAVQGGQWVCADVDTCSVTDVCDEYESWDPDLDACCPDNIWIASCAECPPGTHNVEESVYDDQGCLEGIGCEVRQPCAVHQVVGGADRVHVDPAQGAGDVALDNVEAAAEPGAEVRSVLGTEASEDGRCVDDALEAAEGAAASAARPDDDGDAADLGYPLEEHGDPDLTEEAGDPGDDEVLAREGAARAHASTTGQSRSLAMRRRRRSGRTAQGSPMVDRSTASAAAVP